MKKEDKLIADVNSFCTELRPLEDIFYLENKYNDKLIPLAKKYNLLGMPINKKYGGNGASNIQYTQALARIGKEGTGIRTFFSGHTSLGQKTIQEFGTEQQKKHYLKQSTKSNLILAFALTEPDAGSDPLHLKMKYKKEGNNYILNGTKYLISNAGIADSIIVFAHDNNKKISAFIIDTKNKGITMENLVSKMGMHTTNTGMFELKNFKVPKENLLGKKDGGWNVAKHSLLNGRLSVASGCIGVMEDTIEGSLNYAKERKQHGKVIAKHQLIQEHLALMKVKLEASKLLVHKAAELKDIYDNKKTDFQTVDTAIAEAKFYAANASFEVADRGIQIYGGRGWSYLYRPARHMVDTRVCRIYEGTDEIMKLKIASSMLGKGYEAFH